MRGTEGWRDGEAGGSCRAALYDRYKSELRVTRDTDVEKEGKRVLEGGLLMDDSTGGHLKGTPVTLWPGLHLCCCRHQPSFLVLIYLSPAAVGGGHTCGSHLLLKLMRELTKKMARVPLKQQSS